METCTNCHTPARVVPAVDVKTGEAHRLCETCLDRPQFSVPPPVATVEGQAAEPAPEPAPELTSEPAPAAPEVAPEPAPEVVPTPEEVAPEPTE